MLILFKMENLTEYTNLELYLLLVFILLLLFYFFENRENIKNETEAKIYREKYQEIKADFSLVMNEYKETLGLARKMTEATKELKRDCEGLNINLTDILAKMNFWKNKANKLHKQVKYLQRKCKNNNTK